MRQQEQCVQSGTHEQSKLHQDKMATRATTENEIRRPMVQYGVVRRTALTGPRGEGSDAFSKNLSYQTPDFGVKRLTFTRMVRSKSVGPEASAQLCGLRAGGPHRILNRYPETFVLSASRFVPFQKSLTSPSIIFGRYPKLL